MIHRKHASGKMSSGKCHQPEADVAAGRGAMRHPGHGKRAKKKPPPGRAEARHAGMAAKSGKEYQAVGRPGRGGKCSAIQRAHCWGVFWRASQRRVA